jgi:hypothetical protein
MASFRAGPVPPGWDDRDNVDMADETTDGGVPLFRDHISTAEAAELIRLARSSRSEDIDKLIEIGMTRGLRHPRFAIDAIEAEIGQRFARESTSLARQTVKLSWLLFGTSVAAAIAAIASAIAAFVR